MNNKLDKKKFRKELRERSKSLRGLAQANGWVTCEIVARIYQTMLKMDADHLSYFAPGFDISKTDTGCQIVFKDSKTSETKVFEVTDRSSKNGFNRNVEESSMQIEDLLSNFIVGVLQRDLKGQASITTTVLLSAIFCQIMDVDRAGEGNYHLSNIEQTQEHFLVTWQSEDCHEEFDLKIYAKGIVTDVMMAMGKGETKH